MSLHPLHPDCVLHPTIPPHQRGAVLFISMILLVVLSLIGIASMQVTTLQERMAGNYLTVNRAFENAEAAARVTENVVGAQVAVNNYYAGVTATTCGNPPDEDAWAHTQLATGGTVTQVYQLVGPGLGCRDYGSGGNSMSADSGPLNASGAAKQGIYEVTSVSSDDPLTPANSASMAVVQTTFHQ